MDRRSSRVISKGFYSFRLWRTLSHVFFFRFLSRSRRSLVIRSQPFPFCSHLTWSDLSETSKRVVPNGRLRRNPRITPCTLRVTFHVNGGLWLRNPDSEDLRRLCTPSKFLWLDLLVSYSVYFGVRKESVREIKSPLLHFWIFLLC